VLWAIEKGQGLKKGEKIKRICQIRVVSTRREPLNAIMPDDVVREGYPGGNADEFIARVAAANRKAQTDPVNRIEFEYV